MMDTFSILLGLAGMIVGLFLWNRLVRYAISIWSASWKGNVPPDMTWEQIAKLMSVTRMCFAGWALIFGGACLYFSLHQSPNIHLAWFFGGMATTPIFIWRTTSTMLRRLKAQATPNS
ncbi:hypothetical protein GCM10025793_06250 [Lysobacter lycopersici]